MLNGTAQTNRRKTPKPPSKTKNGTHCATASIVTERKPENAQTLQPNPKKIRRAEKTANR